MRVRGVSAAGAIGSAILAITGVAAAQGFEESSADQPLIEPVSKPRIALDAGAGVLGFTGGGASLGPTWNVRATAHISNRFGVEANYVGAVNEAIRVDEAMVMTAVNAGVRVNIFETGALPVQPYAVAGIGYAGWSTDAGDPGTMTIPLTVGGERMLSRTVKVGARLNFTPAFFDEFGDGPNAPGGDTWSLSGNVGGAF